MSKIKEWLRAGEAEERFTIEDISKHGCQGGVGGLIYYWETTAFYEDCLLYTSPSPRDS